MSEWVEILWGFRFFFFSNRCWKFQLSLLKKKKKLFLEIQSVVNIKTKKLCLLTQFSGKVLIQMLQRFSFWNVVIKPASMSRFAKLLNSTHLIQQNTEMQNTITWKAVHVTYLVLGGFICTSLSWLSVTSCSSHCCWTRVASQMIECYWFRCHFAEPQKR